MLYQLSYASGCSNRAGDGTRTRDIKLGRLALYQLSYSRVYHSLQLIKKPAPSTTWWGKDSNLRRRKPADLQSAPVGHLGTPPDSRITIRKVTRPWSKNRNPTQAVRADGENRTRNLPITNQLLRQLSYVSKQRFYASLLE